MANLRDAIAKMRERNTPATDDGREHLSDFEKRERFRESMRRSAPKTTASAERVRDCSGETDAA